MDNREIVSRLLKSDLTVLKNVSALFDMARNMEDLSLCFKARQYAQKLASKGDLAAYDLVKETYLWAAPYDLDSYLIYLEWNRKPEERFYLPRRKQLLPVVQALQDLVDDKLDELFLSMPPRVGKLLADSTPVLTTKGWKKHGDLVVGDFVFSPEGRPVRVIAVHPKHHTTHTVTMADGSQYKCHFRHEWKVYDRKRQKEVIIETQEMIGNLKIREKVSGKEKIRNRYMLPLTKPIVGEKKELPVKPYTLGAWLGDGTNKSPRLTCPKSDEVIFDSVEKDGYIKKQTYIHKTTGVPTSVFYGLREDLSKIDMCHSQRVCEKHIPEIYLTASIEDRLELLAGLLDTDGTLVEKEHRYHFSTASENLKNDFIRLVSTFGWRSSVICHEPKLSSSGIQGRKCVWSVGFNPTFEIPCRVQRKRLSTFSKQRKIAIESIEESEPEQGNCITVEGGMYLVGDRLTPTHNTTLLMLFLTWLIGRNSERSNLYSAFSDTITSAFYSGVLEVLNDPTTYLWHDIFPKSKIVSTNSKNETINIDRNKRYASLTCRSLYGTLNGSCDADGMLISDDLLSGIEEALNKDRMITAWGKVDNNLLSRAKGSAKILWCGTRWSMTDPIGLRIDTVMNNDKFKNRRVKIVNIPALNENDESNFDYMYGVGFSTEVYHQRRASFERNNDMASWLAQYMGEPIERDGAVFSPDDFRYYNGVLPDGDPDRVFTAVDPAWGGGDFVAAPIICKYGNDLYVTDVVYDNSDKRVTQRLVADKVVEHNVAAVQVEATKTTEEYANGIEAILSEYGRKVNLTTKTATQTKGGKQQRIFDKAPDIRERMIFLENGKRSKAYQLFMQNVFSFKMVGKNKNDDAPDSLCMAIEMDQATSVRPLIMQRLW